MNQRPNCGMLMTLLEGGGPQMRFQDPALEVSGRRRMYWRIRPYIPVVTEDGTVQRLRRPIRLGFCDEMTRSEAKQKKQEVMATLNGGRFIIQSQLPFRALAERFLAVRVPQLAFSTQGKYTGIIERHILPAFKDLQLFEIDRPTVEAWLIHKAADGLSHASRLDLRNVLSAIFRQARNWKLWDGDNPASGAHAGRGGPVREFKKLRDEDLIHFLDALPATAIATVETARLIVLTALVAGLRISEVLGLQWGDIDTHRQTVTVNRRLHRGDVDTPKSRASRRTRQIGPLTVELIAMRAPGALDTDWIFRRPDGRELDDRDLQQNVFRPAAEAVKIYTPGFGIHTFRRMSITWRQEEGATPVEAMRQAGHARIDTTLLYTLSDEVREKQIAERLMARIQPPPAGMPQ